MTTLPNHNTTVLNISGSNNKELFFLANLYYEPIDPNEITSMIAELSHRPDILWKTIYSVESWLTSMDRSKKGNLYAVSMDGELHTNESGSWMKKDLNCPNGLNDIFVASDESIFAIGMNGERVHLHAGSIRIRRDKSNRRLNAVHGTSGTDVFAVGDTGLIYHYNGSEWIEFEPITNCNLLSVLSLSANESYVAGTNGILMKWDGKNWWSMDIPELTITSLAWYQNVLYVAAGDEGLYILDGRHLKKEKNICVYTLETINDLLFAIGNKLVAQYNGKEWWGGELDL